MAPALRGFTSSLGQRRAQHLDEGKRARGQQAPSGRHAPDGDRRQSPLGQDAHQQSLFEPFADEAVGQCDDAHAVGGEFALQARRVGGQRPVGHAFPLRRSVGEAPGQGFAAGTDQAQPDVSEQVLGALGMPVAREIGRARVEPVVQLGELARHQRAVVGQAAGHAQGDVETLGDEVDAPRREVEFEAHLGVAGGELDQERRQVEFDEVGWQRCAQHAARDSLPVLRQRRRRLGLLLQPARVFEDALAEVGERQPARAARQQSLAEARLERADPPRDGRFGQPAAFGGAREAAGGNHPGEEDQVVGVE